MSISIGMNQLIVGRPVLSVNRFCANNQEQADMHCLEPGYSFCESCSTDGCNEAAKNGPVALIIMAIAVVSISRIF